MKDRIKTAAIIYSRSDSTRLPKKAFLPFGKTNLISHVAERASYINVDEIILATTDRDCDAQYDSILDDGHLNKTKKIKIFRGSCDDVVSRTIAALNKHKIDRFCRINGDCPFFPYNHINNFLYNTNFSFINNIRHRSFPYGLSIEILDTNFYIENSKNVDEHFKEHVTQHLYNHDKFFREKCISLKEVNRNYILNRDRFVIDTADDYNFWVERLASDSIKTNTIFL
jgi:spore coat polysaccharide biosynthesis protein SpsF